MNLSKRLQAVATLVDTNASVIDVGCDHAYLDIYLTLNNSNNCLATDININALNSAKENIKKYKLTRKIKTKLTNGLKDIDVKDNDNIVICGMGTYTILDILQTNILSNTLIISSNNNPELLRRKLIELGYYIDSEIFLYDMGKAYIIIKFKKGIKKYNKFDYIYGPILRKNLEYKKYLKKNYKKIIKNISNKKILLKLKYILKIIIIKYI